MARTKGALGKKTLEKMQSVTTSTQKLVEKHTEYDFYSAYWSHKFGFIEKEYTCTDKKCANYEAEISNKMKDSLKNSVWYVELDSDGDFKKVQMRDDKGEFFTPAKFLKVIEKENEDEY